MLYDFVTLDVFTDRMFGGNPLAVLPDARRLTTEQMQALADRRGAPARRTILLWESGPLPRTDERLRSELGIVSVEFSPCEGLAAEARAGGADYLVVMNANLDRLAAALAD